MNISWEKLSLYEEVKSLLRSTLNSDTNPIAKKERRTKTPLKLGVKNNDNKNKIHEQVYPETNANGIFSYIEKTLFKPRMNRSR